MEVVLITSSKLCHFELELLLFFVVVFWRCIRCKEQRANRASNTEPTPPRNGDKLSGHSLDSTPRRKERENETERTMIRHGDRERERAVGTEWGRNGKRFNVGECGQSQTAERVRTELGEMEGTKWFGVRIGNIIRSKMEEDRRGQCVE